MNNEKREEIQELVTDEHFDKVLENNSFLDENKESYILIPMFKEWNYEEQLTYLALDPNEWEEKEFFGCSEKEYNENGNMLWDLYYGKVMTTDNFNNERLLLRMKGKIK